MADSVSADAVSDQPVGQSDDQISSQNSQLDNVNEMSDDSSNHDSSSDVSVKSKVDAPLVVHQTRSAVKHRADLLFNVFSENCPIILADFQNKFDNFTEVCVDISEVQASIRNFDSQVAEMMAHASELEILCNTHDPTLYEDLLPSIQYFAKESSNLKKDLENLVTKANEEDSALKELEEDRAKEAARALSLERFKQFQAEREAKKRRKVGIIPAASTSPPPITAVDSPAPPPIVSNPDSGFRTIEQLAECMMNMRQQPKRQVPEPKTFAGSPMEFADWESDLQAHFKAENMTGAEGLKLLKRTLSGKARKAVAGQLMDNTDDAYYTALRTLRERFGSHFSIGRSMRQKALSWNKIKQNQSDNLRDYADYLLHLKGAMKHNPELLNLNDSLENEQLVAKLPDALIEHWAQVIKDTRRNDGRYPTFREFANFVDGHASTACEPVMRLRESHQRDRRHKHQDDSSEQRDRRHKRQDDSSEQRDRRHKRQDDSSEQKQRTRVHTIHASNTVSTPECLYCQKTNHELDRCFSFAKLERTLQKEFILTHKLCWGCLEAGHMSSSCENRKTCSKCGKEHPTCLHWERRPQSAKLSQATSEKTTPGNKTQPTKENNDESTPRVLSVKVLQTSKSAAFNMVVPVYISTGNSEEKLVYAMLDTQSDDCFLLQDVADELNPRSNAEEIIVDTLTGQSLKTVRRFQDLKIRGYKQDATLDVEAYEWREIACDRSQIPDCFNVTRLRHLKDIAHQLPPPLDAPVALLLGRPCSDAFAPLEVINGGRGQPFAAKSLLGWYVMGRDNRKISRSIDSKAIKVSVKSSLTSPVLVEEDDIMMSQNDIKFLSIMNKETVTTDEGSYQMPLPFKSRPFMPNNRQQAMKRLSSLTNKFHKDENFKVCYTAFMDELIIQGHAQEVSSEPTSGEVWYVPHFAVKHPKKDKLRVVFDCSAKYGATSLNDKLLQGPDLLNSLLGILCRFRKEPVAVACDIEKMYYNFFVEENDRDFLRFLWPNKDGVVKEYRMTVHLFGAVSSPAVATYGLRKLAMEHREEFPSAADFICKDFYVDDGVTSVSNDHVAKALIGDAVSLCKAGNLRLHKFISNSPSVMENIPESEATDKQQLFSAAQSTHRTLGMEWSVSTDTLRFSSQLQPQPHTRRGILSVVAQIYDPLGFVAPFTLQGKNILQKINHVDLDWDEPLPPEITQQWHSWTNQLQYLDTIQIPRCMKPADFGKATRVELHHFCDASFSGIGACSYVKLYNTQESIHSSLLMAKSKVVPSKGRVTIPRLELQGAVLATKLSKTLKKELNLAVDEEYFWCDSKIVLGYISNDDKKFHVYVANRVREIRECSAVNSWRHIQGSLNPADLASRGMECNNLSSSIWFEGPPFLRQKQNITPEEFSKDLDHEDPEVKSLKTVHATSTGNINPIQALTNHYGDYNKLKRAVAYLQLMIKDKQWKHKAKWKPNLTAKDLQKAELSIIQTAQKQAYSEEYHILAKSEKISKKSSIANLTPYLTDEGIIRVGGRAQKSTILGFKEQHPVIIPKTGHLAVLLIRDVHLSSHHCGSAHTLTQVRQAGFWVVGGNRLTKSITGNCVICKRLRGNLGTQQMGQLPAVRVESSAPFTHVGIDCFGPFNLKERRTELKKYGLMLTCMYSRAVHLEVLEDMTTDSFLNALRCFLCIRGKVQSLYCDNGTNFVGAKNELSKLLSQADPALRSYFTKNSIDFVMNTPTASHQGGVWERQIRTARSILDEIFLRQQGRFDTSMLRTAFCEAAATINSRPLSAMQINNHETLPITPNMILTGKLGATDAPPPGKFPTEQYYCNARWKRVQAAAEEFWIKWQDEYLKEITRRQIWKERRPNLERGDLVLVADCEQPRNHWKTGVIEGVSQGDDGLVRSVTVRLASRRLDKQGKRMDQPSIIKRPVQKLVKLLGKQKDDSV